jgi:hypothetical protein
MTKFIHYAHSIRFAQANHIRIVTLSYLRCGRGFSASERIRDAMRTCILRGRLWIVFAAARLNST